MTVPVAEWIGWRLAEFGVDDECPMCGWVKGTNETSCFECVEFSAGAET